MEANTSVAMKHNTCIVGIWHLGSVYSACMADLGYCVTGVDSNTARVEALNRGEPPLFEPGLAELVSKNIEAGRLRYTTGLAGALKGAKFVMVTFDTPVDDNDEADLSPVLDACHDMGPHLEDGVIIIISSQVPVGTCDGICAGIREQRPSLKFDIAYSPENLRLGGAIDYFKQPDRIIIGADDSSTLDMVEGFFNVIPCSKLRMGLRSAEMSKHAINAFLATSISFANEIGNICDETGADALEVAKALKSEARIGPKLPLLPGLAFAGGTLARDLKALQKLGQDSGYETLLIEGALAVNRRQNNLVLRKLLKQYDSVKGLTVGILGLTYKPGTSTLRRSAALEIIAELIAGGALVKAFDPKADMGELVRPLEFEVCANALDAARGSDALVLVTEWPEFKTLDYDEIKSAMKKPVFIDAKNTLDLEQMIRKGFIYFGVGRGR